MSTPALELLFEIHCTLAPALELGATPHGLRRVIDITGGRFEGPLLRGTILPGGADWQVVRADGVTELQAHYILRTHDGVLLQVRNWGLRHGPPDVMARMAAGQQVEPTEYYCRTIPAIEAPEGPYAWLNRHVYIATAARYPDSIVLKFFSVL